MTCTPSPRPPWSQWLTNLMLRWAGPLPVACAMGAGGDGSSVTNGYNIGRNNRSPALSYVYDGKRHEQTPCDIDPPRRARRTEPFDRGLGVAEARRAFLGLACQRRR